MEVAVIILNWNGAALLREFLPAVIANTNTAIGRIIVADNGSTDDSMTVLRDEFPMVEILAFDKNYGFAEGYNRAFTATPCKYTVLLNSDVAPAPRWLDELYAFMESHPDVAACQPKVLSYKDRAMFEYAGASGGFLDRNGYPYCRGRIFGTCERDNGQYDTPIDVFWATGAALMVRTEVYQQVGGLDARFFAHMEEIDLCWRIHLAGWRVMAVPQSVVYHLGGASLSASNPRKTYLNFRNNLLMMHKNLPDSSRHRRILRRMVLDGVAGAKFLLTLDFRNFMAVIRAHRDFRAMRTLYTEHPDTDLLDQPLPNILTAYYLRRKRTFSSLKV